MPLNFFRNFIQLESASSIILFIAALCALIFANTPLHLFYHYLLTTPLSAGFNGFQTKFSLEHFINDGLMTIFFLLVSLEIKRELINGELNSHTKALLPIIAAVGGMLVPALIFVAINLYHHTDLGGWAIPTATDIAFSLGVLTLLGKRIPASLKIFLTALAIIDDLGAIIIIAIFYTDQIAFNYLFFAAVCLIALMFLNRLNINRFWPYGIIGIILWFCITKSGVHATIAGVLIGLIIPMQPSKDPKKSLLNKLEHKLHPWVAYGVLPLFAFANAGLSFTDIKLATVFNPLVFGIAAGLFLGKQIGVFGATWLAIKLKLARMPSMVNWSHLYGAAIICGMGFTMSLFIGILAYPDGSANTSLVRFGVILGSLLSGLVGYLVLRMTKNKL